MFGGTGLILFFRIDFNVELVFVTSFSKRGFYIQYLFFEHCTQIYCSTHFM